MILSVFMTKPGSVTEEFMKPVATGVVVASEESSPDHCRMLLSESEGLRSISSSSLVAILDSISEMK